MHTELLTYFTTAAGTTGAAAAAVTGDSLTIKNNRGVSGPEIIAVWAMNQTSGFHQLAWPTCHDTTRGYRFAVEAGDTSPHLARGMSLPITAQETISATIAGSATAGDVELGCLLVHYPDLPGVDQRTLTWAQLQDRYQKLTTVFATIAGGGSGYSGGELINAESDLLLANRDYAVLGMSTTVDVAAITLVGPDTGYCRIGVPGADQLGFLGQDFFCDLARTQNKSLIPIINSGNRNATTVGIVQDENNVNAIVTLHLALLAK